MNLDEMKQHLIHLLTTHLKTRQIQIKNETVDLGENLTTSLENYLTIYLDKLFATEPQFDSFFKRNDTRLVFLQEYFDDVVCQTVVQFTL
jgi:hypothetical protein